MNLRTSGTIGGAALAVALSFNANATVVSGGVTAGGGSFIILTPPLSNPHGPANSVGNNTFQLQNLYAFNEDQNVLVGPSALSVDEIYSGGAGTIAAGTEVASHYVFYDPSSGSIKGYVDFDAKILAVITSTSRLLASDYLANTGINYLNPAARGLEPGDSTIIDPSNDHRLLVNLTASTPGDYVRVLTEHSPSAVPEAGATWAMAAFGVAAMGALRRRLLS